MLPTINLSSLPLPPIVAEASPHVHMRFLEFFAANIRNVHTRRSYAKAAGDFLSWCFGHGVRRLGEIAPIHVAAWIEMLGQSLAPPSVKQRLAAIRHLFDWLVTGQAIPANPAASVRGPAHSSRTGRTPVLEVAEARALLDAIDVSTPAGLRDRALIGLMIYSFARVGAALAMKREDVFVQGRRLWLRLHEKGGKRHEMPCHHMLEDYLLSYIEVCSLDEGRGPLFRTIDRRNRALSERALRQAEAHAMVRRRARAAGIETRIGNHSFRATGITFYLKNGGTLENAAAMANHSSTRTTQLYDRRRDEISLAEVERVRI
ncbi:tyrosine-type recombinase/integrase [Sphingobium sp. WW5]|uniref:tyrosine-type recombinase/integrase n=1 Tax=unclassified Sphingobium TaxID=2611147 RepID=UPI003C16BF37